MAGINCGNSRQSLAPASRAMHMLSLFLAGFRQASGARSLYIQVRLGDRHQAFLLSPAPRLLRPLARTGRAWEPQQTSGNSSPGLQMPLRPSEAGVPPPRDPRVPEPLRGGLGPPRRRRLRAEWSCLQD